MHKSIKTAAIAAQLIIFGLFFSLDASGQLLINEIEADPGNQQNDSCQYVEIRGTPGATVAANTWMVAINSDSADPGNLSLAVNIGGQVVGANGTITLINTLGSLCPNRTFPAGTNLIQYFSTQRIGGSNINVGSESFAILTTTATLATGQDRDPDDDGILNFTATFIDGVAFIINPDEQFVYPANSPILGTPFSDVPDALVRFPSNNTPFSAAAYYWGEVAESPDESTALIAPLSPNFPVGGVLTPGGTNFPVAAPRIPIADFDGDGRTDRSVFRPSTGQWYLDRSTSGFAVYKWGVSGDILVPGDYDGDNKADTAVWRPSNDPNDADFYILNSNGFTFTALSLGSTGDIPIVGDFDGDGKSDFVVWRPSNAFWYLYESTTQTVRTAFFGLNGDVPFSMDFDGDGKANLAIYRPSTQFWYIAKPTGVPAQNFDALPFGLPGDILVPGDYDGDAKSDIAVYRPSNGVWYVRRSLDLTISYTTFGLPTDIPVPGDYDGDGRVDVAVFRDSSGSGVWYVNGSTAGLSILPFGFGNDKPVPAAYRP